MCDLLAKTDHRLLEGKLNYKYTEALPTETKDREDLVDLYYKLEAKFERLKSKTPTAPRPPRGTSGGNGTAPTAPGVAQGSGLKPYAQMPREFKELKKLEPEEKASIIVVGGCVRCRRIDHNLYSLDCPIKQYKRPPPRANASSITQTPANP